MTKPQIPDGVTPYEYRVNYEKVPVKITDGDYTTSEEARAVLHRHGVRAWEKWCAENKP